MVDTRWELRLDDQFKFGIDPRLQFLLLQTQLGRTERRPALGGPEPDPEIDVVVRLTQETASIPPEIVRHRRYGDIVVGKVRLSNVVTVKRSPTVRSIKSAPPVRQANEIAVRKSFGRFVGNGREGWPTGKGVVVGIVDYGCAYKHPNFRRTTAPFGTRIEAIWEQAKPAAAGAPSPARFGYGREHTREAIDRALATPPTGSLVEYDPLGGYFTDRKRGQETGAHGTRVMDIAAGNGAGTGTAGIAPEADIVFVQLPALDWQGLGEFANSTHILDAVSYVFERAGDRPAVVNISLSTNGGPHDGSNPVELGLECLVRGSDRAVVIASGNEGTLPIHAGGRCGPGRPVRLDWTFPSTGGLEARVRPEIEVWYPAGAVLEVVVTPGGGRPLPPIRRDTAGMIFRDDAMVGAAIHRSDDPNNGASQFTILLEPKAASGTWQIEIVHKAGPEVDVHAWVERQMFGDPALHPQLSSGGAPVTQSFKVGSIACGSKTICVGASENLTAGRVADFSSGGPTRIGGEKPDLCAPGSPVLAAMHDSPTRKRFGSGTSFAAPMVAGAVALLFEAAKGQGRRLTAGEVGSILRETAAPLPGQARGWRPETGFGELRIAAALKKVGWRLPGEEA